MHGEVFWNYSEEAREEAKTTEIITLVQKEFEEASGILLVGSSANGKRRPGSDYDFTVIHRDLGSLSRTAPFLNDVAIENSEMYDIYALKSVMSDREVGVHIMHEDVFHSICEMNVGEISVFRHKPWDEYDYGKSVQGRQIAVRPRADELPTGGYRMFLPTMIEFGEEVFTGVHAHMFLTNPKVIKDDDGSISTHISSLWTRYLTLMEQQVGYVSFDQVMGSLWKSESFNQQTLFHIGRQVERYLRAQ